MAIEEERGGEKITLQLLALLFGLFLPLAVELCVWQEGRRRAKDPIFSPPPPPCPFSPFSLLLSLFSDGIAFPILHCPSSSSSLYSYTPYSALLFPLRTVGARVRSV